MTDPAEDVVDIQDKMVDLNVVRDNTFSRAVADDVVLLSVSTGLEISFLQFGASFSQISTPKGEGVENRLLELSPNITEVARIRIDYQAATHLAMMILERGFQNDVLRGDFVLKTISQWAAAAADTSSDDQ